MEIVEKKIKWNWYLCKRKMISLCVCRCMCVSTERISIFNGNDFTVVVVCAAACVRTAQNRSSPPPARMRSNEMPACLYRHSVCQRKIYTNLNNSSYGSFRWYYFSFTSDHRVAGVRALVVVCLNQQNYDYSYFICVRMGEDYTWTHTHATCKCECERRWRAQKEMVWRKWQSDCNKAHMCHTHLIQIESNNLGNIVHTLFIHYSGHTLYVTAAISERWRRRRMEK